MSACTTPPPVVGRWTVVPAEPCGPVDGIVAPDPGSADPERCTRKTPRSQGAMLETFPPGRRVEIIDDGPLAIVGEAGGGIRCHEVGGRSVFDPYPVHTLCDGAQGSAHPLAQPPDRRTVPLQRQTPAAHQHRTGRWHHPRISRVTPPRGDDTGLRLHRPRSGRTRPGPGPPRVDRSTNGRSLGGGRLPGHRALCRATLAAFGITRRSTQVGAVTVATGSSYITTRDLTGSCENADWTTHMSGKERSYQCDRRS